jgi:hypothetical protein
MYSQVPVAHTCNPSYSGGRDQEDPSLKPAWANSFRDPISKKKTQQKKRAGGASQAVEHLPSEHEALSSNSSTTKMKKKKKILSLPLK